MDKLPSSFEFTIPHWKAVNSAVLTEDGDNYIITCGEHAAEVSVEGVTECVDSGIWKVVNPQAKEIATKIDRDFVEVLLSGHP